MLTQSYLVSNISCAHCTHTIEKELKLVPGVRAASADLDTKKVVVNVDAAQVLPAVEQTLVEIGYPGVK